jgi:Ca-activated chloride channel homolog
MALLWPGFLVLLILIPLFIWLFWCAQHRRRSAVLRYSSLALIQPAMHGLSCLRRYIPPTLFLLALAVLIIAFSRPAIVTNISTRQTTIILAIDVSPSMGYTDIQPTRLSVAEATALSFIKHQKSNTQIGIVAFSGDARVILSPTTDQAALKLAIKSLTLGQGTAIGNGILMGLKAIAQVNMHAHSPGEKGDRNGSDLVALSKSVEQPAIIILLTDGANNCCEPPLKAARIAVEQGVPVYTIGFGLKQNSLPAHNANSNGDWIPSAFANFRANGSNPWVDELTLKQIAMKTGGKYYTASNARELQEVFEQLPTRQIIKQEFCEISVVFVALGVSFLITALMLSLLWNPQP